MQRSDIPTSLVQAIEAEAVRGALLNLLNIYNQQADAARRGGVDPAPPRLRLEEESE
jgi:hypothetical protein